MLSVHTDVEAYAAHYGVTNILSQLYARARVGDASLSVALMRRAALLADTVVVPHPRLASWFHGLPVNIVNVEHAIDPTTIPGVGELLRPRRQVLFVGRLAREKGLPFLLRSFAVARALSPDVVLTIIGRGAAERRLRALSNELGLNGSVEWCGELSNADVLRRMAGAAVLAVPAMTEVRPMVIEEARAVRLPVIVRDARLSGVDALVAPTLAEFGSALVAQTRSTGRAFVSDPGALWARAVDAWRHTYEALVLRDGNEQRVAD